MIRGKNSPLASKLIVAAKEGNLKLLRKHAGELPFIRDHKWNASVLSTCAMAGHLECTEFVASLYPELMRVGMSFDAHVTPLYLACQ